MPQFWDFKKRRYCFQSWEDQGLHSQHCSTTRCEPFLFTSIHSKADIANYRSLSLVGLEIWRLPSYPQTMTHFPLATCAWTLRRPSTFARYILRFATDHLFHLILSISPFGMPCPLQYNPSKIVVVPCLQKTWPEGFLGLGFPWSKNFSDFSLGRFPFANAYTSLAHHLLKYDNLRTFWLEGT